MADEKVAKIVFAIKVDELTWKNKHKEYPQPEQWLGQLELVIAPIRLYSTMKVERVIGLPSGGYTFILSCPEEDLLAWQVEMNEVIVDDDETSD